MAFPSSSSNFAPFHDFFSIIQASKKWHKHWFISISQLGFLMAILLLLNSALFPNENYWTQFKLNNQSSWREKKIMSFWLLINNINPGSVKISDEQVNFLYQLSFALNSVYVPCICHYKVVPKKLKTYSGRNLNLNGKPLEMKLMWLTRSLQRRAFHNIAVCENWVCLLEFLASTIHCLNIPTVINE